MRVFLLLLVFFTFACSYSNGGDDNKATYRGVIKCKSCHIKIYKSWKTTKHSTTYERLNEQERKDPKCFECHTTGNNPNFPGVQCEACHGPGSKFSDANIMNQKKYQTNRAEQRKMALEAGLVIAPDENNCKQCHNERSPHYKGFDFKARYEEVDHKNE